nr:uncharacterized protein LOC123757582 isoform X1 [Procambarus clarkii]
MEHYPHIRKPIKENIDITVNLRTSLTVSLCMKIVEDMLKYILYQRRQIPVHFDVLAREAASASHRDPHQDPNRDPHWDPHRDPHQDPHTQLTNKNYDPGNQGGSINQVYSRKKEVARQTLERKRERWLVKVNNFVANFKRVMQVLRTEFEGGDVLAVNLILGSSVMSSREVFSIVFPPDYASAEEIKISNGRHTIVEMLRALVGNEDLVKLVNRPLSVQKVWVMVQKSHSPNQTTLSPLDSSSCDLVLHLGYSPNLRAKVVQIKVCHPPAVIPMDLTPCVGTGITEHTSTSLKKNGTKRALAFGIPGVSKRYSANDISSYNRSSMEDESSVLCEANILKITRHKEIANLRTLNRMKANDLIDKNLGNQRTACLKLVLETPMKPVLDTPINKLSRIESIIETPTIPSLNLEGHPTPSKTLTTQLGKCTLADRCMDAAVCTTDGPLWYQIDQVICGFKDVCFL